MRQGNDLLNGRSRTDQGRGGDKEPGGKPVYELQWRVIDGGTDAVFIGSRHTPVLGAGVALRWGHLHLLAPPLQSDVKRWRIARAAFCVNEQREAGGVGNFSA
jgi:hypothetical protein